MFPGDQIARLRVKLEGSSTEFNLPLPMEPENIEFNDLLGVLCEHEVADWWDLVDK